ncbi:MAG: GumC family protein [Erythrobacter sp.]
MTYSIPDYSDGLQGRNTAPMLANQANARPSEQAPAEDDGIDFSWIWQVLLTRWQWIAGAGAVGLAAALVGTLLATPLYRSTATLELNPPTVPVLSGAGGAEQLTVPATDSKFLATQYGLLTSRDLARRVVERLTVTQPEGINAANREAALDASAAGLAASIRVFPVPDSRLVNLSFASASPQQAADVVNAYAEAFLESNLERRFKATEQARNFLSERLQAQREQLNNAERQLVDYARANGIIMPTVTGQDGGATLNASALSTINAALSSAQQRRITAEERFRQGGSITTTQVSTAALRSQKATLEAEYREKSTYLLPDFPEMVTLREKISAVSDAIAQENSSASEALRAEYAAALAEENSLKARVDELSRGVLSEQERSVEYNVLQRELDSTRTLYEALLARYNEIGAVEGIGSPLASIVDRGQVPLFPYSPKVPLNLAIGLMVGLLLGAMLALAYEFLTDKIKSSEDVKNKLRVPYLGSVPKLGRKEALATELDDATSKLSEAYGSVLAKLRFCSSEGMPKVLAVTSTEPSEGKSTTALVLAIRLARSGKRVLLLDGDMRRPSLVTREGQDRGLSTLLSGQDDWTKSLVPTNIPNLIIIPAGPTPPNPSVLLESPRIAELLAVLQTQFDHVIIDCPPVQGFADALILGSASTGVVVVVESGKVRRSTILDTISQLRSAGSWLVGAVLTKDISGNSAGKYYYSQTSGEDSAEKSRGNSPDPHELMPIVFKD